MKKGSGLPVFAGIAFGPPVILYRHRRTLPASSGDPSMERARFKTALETARQQLILLSQEGKKRVGKDLAAIVETQLLILDDPSYLSAVSGAIENGAPAEAAVLEAGERLARPLSDSDDECLRARSSDILDLARRICDILSGKAEFQFPDSPFVLVADELSPSETLRLPTDRVLAFITRHGSRAGHTAILARTLGIPSLVQSDLTFEIAGSCETLAVDGFTGTWYADPDEETLRGLRSGQFESAALRSTFEAYRNRETVTRSGLKIRLSANIGSPRDAVRALAEDAEGVGLMRSEFLYLERNCLPTEEELYEAYKEVALIMGDRPVVIRTLDIGTDKQVSYLEPEKEENPALGLRGLRFCLTRPEIFLPQLRAIYRAAAHGNLHIMFPMVASLWELQEAKRLCESVRTQLEAEGCCIQKVPIGVMIETPAAAILAGELAKEAAFFSVGTNDLTQYTLAADHLNPRLDSFYDPYHPAVLALLRYVAAAALEKGIGAGVCGELAADPRLQKTLIQMGYTELSMAPGRILESRKRICESEL